MIPYTRDEQAQIILSIDDDDEMWACDANANAVLTAADSLSALVEIEWKEKFVELLRTIYGRIPRF